MISCTMDGLSSVKQRGFKVSEADNEIPRLLYESRSNEIQIS